MSRFTQPSQDDGSYILVIRMDNARNLSSILKTVSFREVSYMHQQASNSLKSMSDVTTTSICACLAPVPMGIHKTLSVSVHSRNYVLCIAKCTVVHV